MTGTKGAPLPSLLVSSYKLIVWLDAPSIFLHNFFFFKSVYLIGSTFNFSILQFCFCFVKSVFGKRLKTLGIFSIHNNTSYLLCAVAPVCYAHLAATQLGQFMKFEDRSETASSHGSAGAVLVPQLPKLQDSVCNSMFFCWGLSALNLLAKTEWMHACVYKTVNFSFWSSPRKDF